MIDVRFPTALQIMLSLMLAEEQGAERLSSGQLAEGIGSTSSFVRKLLAPLVEDGLVASTMGREGGLRIGRQPERITLLDIYRSVTRRKQLWPARDNIRQRCLVSRNVGALFARITDDVDAAIAERLGKETLASCFAALAPLDAAAHRATPSKGSARRRSART
jgi:Rrf2 family transcriptional repressor of oqxAB